MKKSLIILIAAIAIIAVGAASTIAWITSTTGTLTNEFTVGDVDITLTEPDWFAADDNLLVPGKALTKDPTVTVEAGSEKCYVFVEIVTTAKLEAVIDYTVDPAWTALGASYPGVYYQVVNKNTGSDTVLPVLTGDQVTVPTTVVKADLALVDTATDTMKITAYAIQFDYLTAPVPPVTAEEAAWILVSAS